MKPLVYIAAPYSIGDKEANTRASLDAANELLATGLFIPFPPLLSHYWDLYSPKDYEEWLEIDKHWLSHCDAMLRLPGESAGADREEMWARERGLSVFHSLEDMMTWGFLRSVMREDED